jgi:hypothetical protein
MGAGMKGRANAIVAVLTLMALLLPLAPALADQAFQRFLPLFVELDGWQGKKADGMSMEMQNVSMTTATRDYQRGSAQAHASVMVGQAAVGTLAPLKNGVNVQSTQGHMVSSTMNGMPVIKTFTSAQKSGSIVVGLDSDALFSFAYSGIAEDEALAMAQKFDWKAMQTAAQKK